MSEEKLYNVCLTEHELKCFKNFVKNKIEEYKQPSKFMPNDLMVISSRKRTLKSYKELLQKLQKAQCINSKE